MSNLLVIVGYGSGGQVDVDELHKLANVLAQQLDIPVQTAFLDASPSVGEAVQLGVTDHQPNHVVVLPLFPGASAAKISNVQLIVDAAQDRWSDVAVIYGTPPNMVAAYTRLLPAQRDTPLIVVGRSHREPAETEQMAQALRDTGTYAAVEVAVVGKTLTAAIERLGTQHLTVMPYVLYEMSAYQAIQKQLQALDANINLTPPLPIDASIVEAISQRYHEALTEITSEAGQARRVAIHAHGPEGTHTHGRVMLPPRYQTGAEVSAAPMGAADLIFDAEGRVAWDQIWSNFCDLALAGGPPHRGTLLEPVTPESVAANPTQYQAVVAEIERGIGLVTQLPIVTSRSPGWVGVQCASEEMALWLLRAIIVENVSVRRENDVLYLPAGPDFRLDQEIKNVITVIAKTHHYWTEHITSR